MNYKLLTNCHCCVSQGCWKVCHNYWHKYFSAFGFLNKILQGDSSLCSYIIDSKCLHYINHVWNFLTVLAIRDQLMLIRWNLRHENDMVVACVYHSLDLITNAGCVLLSNILLLYLNFSVIVLKNLVKSCVAETWQQLLKLTVVHNK